MATASTTHAPRSAESVAPNKTSKMNSLLFAKLSSTRKKSSLALTWRCGKIPRCARDFCLLLSSMPVSSSLDREP